MASIRMATKGRAVLRISGWDNKQFESESYDNADPLGFAAGDKNIYRYVHNDPETIADPTGLEGVDRPRPVTTTEYPLPNPANTFVLAGPPIRDPDTPDTHRPMTAPMDYYTTVRGVPASQFFTFGSMHEFEMRVDEIRTIIAANNMHDVNIIISVHARPGLLFFGNSPDRTPTTMAQREACRGPWISGIENTLLGRILNGLQTLISDPSFPQRGRQNLVTTRPQDAGDLENFLNALSSIFLDTDPCRTGAVYLDGCNTLNYDPNTPGNRYTQDDTLLGASLFSTISGTLGGGIGLFGEIGFSSVSGANMMIQGTSPGDGVVRYTPTHIER